MKLIVTGATGFIGRNIVQHFHDLDFEVIATGRNPDIGRELSRKDIEFRAADITDGPALNRLFSKADCVVHCAALPGDWGKYDDFYRANVVGSRNIMEACERHVIEKVIFISSPSVYFNDRDRFDIKESDPLPSRQLSHYGKTKRIAEREFLAWSEKGNPVIVFRPRAVFGAHDNTIIPRILRMAEKKRFPLINDGKALVDITCVENLIRAVEQAIAAPDEAWNEVYNITNGEPITVKDWFSTVLDIFDKPFRPKTIPEPLAKAIALMMEATSRLPFGPQKPSMTRFSVGYMAKSMTLSIDKAKRELGYEPVIDNKEGFERYVAWHRGRDTNRESQ